MSRWRRFGEPTPAGARAAEHGEVDYGVFGPGTVAWEILLHPSTIVFQSAAQFVLQLTYKPIAAGVRDWDPLSRLARKGELTVMDYFDRAQRNSGIHAPMWLGDTATAQRVAKHIVNIHSKVAADVIDIGEPELGGYAANSPRDSMWATLTEMHTMLWLHEKLAFHGLRRPKKLSPEKRDQFIREVAEYAKLFPAAEEDLPTSMADLNRLYERDADLFGHGRDMSIIPETGQNFHRLVKESLEKNKHPSQRKVLVQLFIQTKLFELPVLALVSGRTRRSMGVSARKERTAFVVTTLAMPLIWLAQRRPVERYFMRMMWGPDAVTLIDSARKVQAEYLAKAPTRTSA